MRHLVISGSAASPVGAGGRRVARGRRWWAAAAATAVAAARLPTVAGARRQLMGLAASAQLRQARQLLDAGWRAYPPLVAVGRRYRSADPSSAGRGSGRRR